MKFNSLFFSAIFLFALGSCNEPRETEESSALFPENPNILLIMTDDVAFEHWGCYGGDLPTPNIDRLAKEGTRFHQAYATAATCTPSRYSILTGEYPGRCRHEEFLSQNPVSSPYLIAWNTPLTGKNTTLHEVLNQAGYFTGFVGKFHIGALHFDNAAYNPDIPQIRADIDVDTHEADSLLGIYQDVIAREVKKLTGADFSEAIQWENPEEIPVKAVREHNLEYQAWGAQKFFENVPKDQPFFLSLNSTALHGPNHYRSLKKDPVYTNQGRVEALRNIMPPRQSVLDRLDSLGIPYGEEAEEHENHYNAGILYLDDQIGVVMDMLESAGLGENTLVILTADHNVEPGKGTIYEKGVNAPFIAWWPGVVEKGSQSYDRIQFTDFLPTFAQLACVELDNSQKGDGQSFAEALIRPSKQDNRMLYFEKGYFRGVSDGEFKYISLRFPEATLDSLKTGHAENITHMGTNRNFFASIAMKHHPGYFDADQLYDLTNDPYEQNNLAYNADYASKLNEMKDSLQQVLSTLRHPYDLEDTGFMDESYYIEATQEAREVGTDWIKWWNREMNYPPNDERRH